MSWIISDIVFYGSANMPEADGVTIGGAVDFSKRVEFEGTAISPSTLFDAVSSSASDTAVKLTYEGRDSTGVVQSETLTLNGTTKVAGTKSLERLLAGVITGGSIAGIANPGGTAAVGDVTLIAHTLTIAGHTMQAGSANASGTPNWYPAIAKLQAGDGAAVSPGMVLHTTGGTGPNQIRRILAINPNGLGADIVAVDRNWTTVPDATTTYEVGHGFCFSIGASNGGVLLSTATQTLAITRVFATATAQASGGSAENFYEKIFVNNNNQVSAVLSAAVILETLAPSVPGSAAMNFALCNALNDTATVANRQTAPASGITAFSSGAPPQTINVPSTNLPASAGSGSATGAQGIWLNLSVPAGTPAWESVPTIRTQGSSS